MELESGLDLGSTDLLTLYFSEPDSFVERSTELALALTTTTEAESCGVVEASFELLTAAGEVAASGQGSIGFAAQSCNGANPPCLRFDYFGAGTVSDQTLLLGYPDYPDELTRLDFKFFGTSRGGELQGNSLFIETWGRSGIVLATRAP